LWGLGHRERLSLTGHTLKTLPSGPKSTLFAVHLAVSPDGKTLASLGADKKIKLWDLRSGKLLQSRDGPAEAMSLAFTDQGKKLQAVVIAEAGKGADIDFKDLGNAPLGPDRLFGQLALRVVDLQKADTATTEKFTATRLAAPAAVLTGDKGAFRLMISGMVMLAGKRNFAPFALALSPDGKTLAIGGLHTSPAQLIDGQPPVHQTGAVLLWDLAKNQEKMVVPGHQSMVLTIAFAPDGGFASAGFDRVVKLWDKDGKERATLTGHRAPVSVVRFSQDGKRLFSGAIDGNIHVWDVATGKATHILRGHLESIVHLAVNPPSPPFAKRGVGGASDGDELVSSSTDGVIKVWKLSEAEGPAPVSLKSAIRHLSFAPDGKTLFAIDHFGVFRRCDAATGKVLDQRRLHPAKTIILAAASSDSNLAAFADILQNTITVRNTTSGNEIFSLPNKKDHGLAYILRFSPDGKYLAAGSGTGQHLGDVTVWSLESGQVVHELGGFTNHVMALAYSADGRFLAAGGKDHPVRVWESASGKQRYLIQRSAEVTAVAFSRDGKLLAVATEKDIAIHRATDGQEVLAFPTYSHSSAVLIFSPDGKRLASGAGGGETMRGTGVKLWDVAGGRETLSLDSSAIVTSVAFAPDGTRLAAAFADEMVTNLMSFDTKAAIHIWEAPKK
jgi:WD40 repeat protein